MPSNAHYLIELRLHAPSVSPHASKPSATLKTRLPRRETSEQTCLRRNRDERAVDTVPFVVTMQFPGAEHCQQVTHAQA